jgi:hypothetical protein
MEHRTVWHTFAERFKTFAKFAGTAIAGIVVFLLVLIGFHGRLIDNIYKNVEDINDGEMPITVTSYPSGPEVVGIIGGSGKGLNCSLPPESRRPVFRCQPGPGDGEPSSGAAAVPTGLRVPRPVLSPWSGDLRLFPE